MQVFTVGHFRTVCFFGSDDMSGTKKIDQTDDDLDTRPNVEFSHFLDPEGGSQKATLVVLLVGVSSLGV